MSILNAIILGLIQGLTEFIPISSTAHLVLAGKVLHIDRTLSAEQVTAFNAVVQLGTLVAVLVYFARDLRDITWGFFVDNLAYVKREKAAIGADARLGWLIGIGTVPIVVFGLAFKKVIEGTFTKNLVVIGGTMVFFALVLWAAEYAGRRTRSIRDLGVFDAVVVGCAQACALIPGASRSGTTITGCLFLGMSRETAARFSFLMSIPAVAAAGLLEFVKEARHLDRGTLLAVAVATVVAGLSGYASIAFLMRYLKTHGTGIFIGYRLVLGGIIFALLALKLVSPV